MWAFAKRPYTFIFFSFAIQLMKSKEYPNSFVLYGRLQHAPTQYTLKELIFIYRLCQRS